MSNIKVKNTKPAQTSTEKPDPETLGKTDPQEHMEGPISSLVQKVKDGVQENDHEVDRDKKDHKKK